MIISKVARVLLSGQLGFCLGCFSSLIHVIIARLIFTMIFHSVFVVIAHLRATKSAEPFPPMRSKSRALAASRLAASA